MPNTVTQNDVVISLGKYSINSTKSGYKRLVEFYNQCNEYSDCTVTIDFSELEFFDANLSAILFSMIYLLNKEKGLKFAIDMNLIGEKFDILMRNGFLEQDIVVEKNDNSCVKLQAFDLSDETSFVDYVTFDLFQNEGLTKLDKTTKNRMITNLLEVFANVTHAKTDHPVFACGQYYPKNKRLKFTIVDLGIGFLRPINEYTKGTINEALNAIEWALEEGASTKKSEPGGNGLTDILSFCKSSESHMNIMTDGVVWGTDFGLIGHFKIEPYCGTIITLDFNCK